MSERTHGRGGDWHPERRGDKPSGKGSLSTEEPVFRTDLFTGRKEIDALVVEKPSQPFSENAIWLERDGDSYIIHVSILDLSQRISDPFSISQDTREAMSLRRRERRPTITISVRLGNDLTVGNHQVRRTSLTTKNVLSYNQENPLLSEPVSGEAAVLEEYTKVAGMLFERRRQRGSLALYDRGKRLITSEEGIVRKMTPKETYELHGVVKEFLILANEAAAMFVVKRGMPAIFRNHFQTYSSLYGTTPAGHYGLQLPAYLHCTSPLSQLTDFMNVRILAALSSYKEPFPYTIDALKNAAAVANKKGLIPEASQENTQEQRPTKKRSKRKRNSKRPPKRASLDKEVDFQEPIIQTDDNAIRFRVDGLRTEQAENDRGRLQNICRHNKSAEPTFKLLSQEGSETTPPFTVRATAVINGIVYESDPCAGNRIKTAQISAARNVLGKLPSSLLAQEIVRMNKRKEQTISTTVKVREVKVRDDNFIDAVQQVCQKKHWVLPSYITNRETVGEPTEEGVFPKIFTCICTITSPGGESISCTAQDPNAKIAKQRAAEQLFVELSRIV